MAWARYAANSHECSSRGDRRFSALFAVLPDGRTIEEAYQLDVKGYRDVSENWKDGKGKPPINGKTNAQLWEEYLELWRVWTKANPETFFELCVIAEKQTLTDKFAKTDINQAHALSDLIDEARRLAALPFDI